MKALSARAFNRARPGDYYTARWPRSLHRDLVTSHFEKAAVAAGTMTDPAWATPLMAPGLAGWLPAVGEGRERARQVAADPVPVQHQDRQADERLEHGVGRVRTCRSRSRKLGFGNVTLPWRKAVSIIVVTKELLQLAAPGSGGTAAADAERRDDRVLPTRSSCRRRRRPRTCGRLGYCNGVTPITATADLTADLKSLVNAFFADRPYPLGAVLSCSPAVTSKIAALDIGRAVTVNGGTLLGLPVVTTPAAGANAIVRRCARHLPGRWRLDLGHARGSDARDGGCGHQLRRWPRPSSSRSGRRICSRSGRAVCFLDRRRQQRRSVCYGGLIVATLTKEEIADAIVKTVKGVLAPRDQTNADLGGPRRESREQALREILWRVGAGPPLRAGRCGHPPGRVVGVSQVDQ